MLNRLLQAVFLAVCIAAHGAETVMAAERVHPCLYLTPQDIERGKRNITQYAWARETADQIKAEADKWASMPETTLRSLLPSERAIFAYGFTSCPECNKPWPWWGASGVCDINRPRTVKCPGCGTVYPNDRYPDNGQGWRDEKSGKTHWFIGVYNSYIAQTITLTALDALSNAYALTGDEKYARAATVLFDSLAQIYPTCTTGSIDYPNAPGGRLERTQYQVARVLVHLARYYDLIYHSPALDAPSQAGEATIRASIEERILKDGGRYCYEQADKGYCGLTNGQADYVRGVLVVGLLLDMERYVDWSLTGPFCVFNFLENNLHHDGQYYETSVGYSQHALNLYVDMAEMLANHRSPQHPNGINLYDHPKLSRALVQGELDILCAGHAPRFGDWGPDVKKLTKEPDLTLVQSRAERLFRRTGSPERRAYWAGVLNDLYKGNVEEGRAEMLPGHKAWLLYHAEPAPGQKSSTSLLSAGSTLLDGKGLAILRSGSGLNGRAALIRYGPSVCHGHTDDLNLNLYALGRELTYDLGYLLGSAHVQRGWAKQTGSHNLVVVNEKPQMEAGSTGGSAHLFAASDGIQMVELSSEGSYKAEGVAAYRRSLALIDSGPDASYLVDFFRVAGGHTHDLLWHALGDKLTTSGCELGAPQQDGSLAGLEYDWGRKVGPDGDIIGQADKGPYWNPPPHNGYGFLHDIRRGPVSGGLNATWTMMDAQSKDALTIAVLPPPGSELITAKAPGILPSYPAANYVVVRRTGEDLTSVFASVLQPYEKANPVKSVERLPVKDSQGLPVGIRVKLAGGQVDYTLSATQGEHVFGSEGGNLRLQGRFAFARLGQKGPQRVLLVGSSGLSAPGITIRADHPGYSGKVQSVDYQKCKIVVGRDMPTDGTLVGAGIYIGRRDYSHNSFYRIRSVAKENGRTVIQLDTGTLTLGRGYVSRDAEPGMHEIRNLVPLEMSTGCEGRDTGYFRGKLMEADDGTRTSIINVVAAGGKKTILVPSASDFRKGARLTIYDIQAGDSFEIPTHVDVSVVGKALKVRATTTGEIVLRSKTYNFQSGTSSIPL